MYTLIVFYSLSSCDTYIYIYIYLLFKRVYIYVCVCVCTCVFMKACVGYWLEDSIEICRCRCRIRIQGTKIHLVLKVNRTQVYFAEMSRKLLWLHARRKRYHVRQAGWVTTWTRVGVLDIIKTEENVSFHIFTSAPV